MSNANILTRAAQVGDGLLSLLARLVGSPRRFTLLASTARTATTSSSQFDAYGSRGLLIYLNTSSASGTGGLLVRVDYLDPETGLWFAGPYAPASAKTTTGTFTFIIGPGVSVGAGTTLNAANCGDRGGILGSEMRVTVLHQDATPYTYSLAIEIL